MPKAKTIDRLELTKRSSAFLRNRDNKHTYAKISDISPDDITPDRELKGRQYHD